MYKLEDIKPKKYPDEKPSESGFDVQYRVLLDDGRQVLFDWNPVTPSETMMTWDRYVEWFIDIPNPPEELRFLAYPQNKPSENGMYYVHLKDGDDWSAWWLDAKNECGWDEWIDWYIPVRLDKENEMMNYKSEDIKPKKYPDEKPSENRAYVNYRVLLDNGTQSLFNWNPISQSDGKMIWNKYVTWFIDIPNPPDELKFLAYPENKPSEDGLYLVHYKPADDWGDIYYPDDNIWDEHIDYFIPYRLDEPVSDADELDEPLGNSERLERKDKVTYKPKDKFSDYTDEDLLLELINRNVMFEASKKTERFVRHYEVFVGIGDDNIASIILPQDSLFELREIVYDKQSSNPCQLESEDEMDVICRSDDTILSSGKDNVVLKNTRNGETDKIVIWKHAFTEICLHWLDLQGYDVVKREPELLPCPFCKSPKFGCKLFRGEVSGMGMKSWIECVDECGYQSAYCDTGEEAIRLHNLIADNAKRSGLCEPGNEYYGLCCDEDGNVLPRKES